MNIITIFIIITITITITITTTHLPSTLPFTINIIIWSLLLPWYHYTLPSSSCIIIIFISSSHDHYHHPLIIIIIIIIILYHPPHKTEMADMSYLRMQLSEASWPGWRCHPWRSPTGHLCPRCWRCMVPGPWSSWAGSHSAVSYPANISKYPNIKYLSTIESQAV